MNIKKPAVLVDKDVEESMKNSSTCPLANGVRGYEIKGRGVVIIVDGTGVCFVEKTTIVSTAVGGNRVVRV